MKLEELSVTYDADKLYKITLDIFSDVLKKITKKNPLSNEEELFLFYEKNISYPIDDLKDDVDDDTEDFYETILIMSWAVYREWAKCILDKKTKVDVLDCINKDVVVKLFMDNLNCEEGIDLYKKVLSSSADL